MIPRFAANKALQNCRDEGYLIDYIDREEFMTMVTEVWTVEQQLIDRERWAAEKAREEERKKAEEAIVTEKFRIAKNLITNGVAIDIIVSTTQLSKAEILELMSES